MFLFHLRGWKRNNHVAHALAARIVEYQDHYPGRPVWIVGYSGGGGMALLTAAALPDGRRLTGVVMLSTAVSPELDLTHALADVQDIDLKSLLVARRVTAAVWHHNRSHARRYSRHRRSCLLLVLHQP